MTICREVVCMTTIAQNLEGDNLKYTVVSYIMQEITNDHLKVDSDKLKKWTIRPTANTKIKQIVVIANKPAKEKNHD